jgi:hypothetical protein
VLVCWMFGCISNNDAKECVDSACFSIIISI